MEVSFGPYRLLVAQRLLLEGDKPVRLGGRAFDILAALVECAGEVVSKEELIARAWPTTFVEEANLKIQVSALRRALGDGQGDHRYIATVVGRGYNFVAPLHKEEPLRVASVPPIAPEALHNLLFATTRMIGREEFTARCVAQLSRRRLVSLVGPGGIGKTTIALAVAEQMIGAYKHGVWLVDLAPLLDPGLVPGAVATVLGTEVRPEDPLSRLVAALRDRRMLLLLDSCERVVAAAADLAEALLTGTPGISILATSREPLGILAEPYAPSRTARQPGAVAWADRLGSGGFPGRATLRRASVSDRRRLRADRCQRRAGRRDMPKARRLAVSHRVRRTTRRDARSRSPGCWLGRQFTAAVKSAAPSNRAAA